MAKRMMVTALLAGGLGATSALAQGGGLRIEVLSSHPALVSGGDALIRVAGAGAAPSVTVGGRDVSAAFQATADGAWIGLVDGLVEGDNTLVATAGGAEARQTLVNHPLSGSLFSGPQQTPFVCENSSHGLPEPADETCAVTPQTGYMYRSTDGTWKQFDPNGQRPTDIEVTTTNEGRTVPMIVWHELGVINRAAYAIALLHDPAEGPLPTPVSRDSGWNGKLIFSHRGGVRPSFHMGTTIGTMEPKAGYVGGENNNLHESLIRRGFAFAGSSLSTTGTTTNHVVQAETTSMVKERFIELFGPPVHTIAMGTSGGSMSQHLIAQNYPGLYDAIMPWRSYPEVVTFQLPLYDCRLLVNYFDNTDVDWTLVQKTLVSGKLDFNFCVVPSPRFPNLDPANCDPSVTTEYQFDPSNPKWANVRCTYQDNLVNVFGTTAVEGAVNAFGQPVSVVARNYWDNEGVQYGLNALNSGVITFAQFLDLNRRIGGYDVNGKFTSQRSVGDPDAIRIVYETGRMNRGQGGLAEIPILDIRGYTDGACSVAPCPPGDPTNVDVHDGYHTLLTRERLVAANGHADNHVRVVITEVGNRGPASPLSLVTVETFDLFDQWVSAIAADTSDRSAVEKMRAHRPAELVDACYTGIDTKITDMDLCGRIFPIGSDARMVAGAPPTNDVVKCVLKPIDAADYARAPSAAEMDQLRAVFPSGVCDFTKPSVGAVPLAGFWLSFPGDARFEVIATAD